jgi:diacylglycerol kinase family enzyme
MLPRFVLYALRGRGQERAPDVIHAHDLDRLELVCDTPQPLQVDGEDLGDVSEVVFEAERDALTVLV